MSHVPVYLCISKLDSPRRIHVQEVHVLKERRTMSTPMGTLETGIHLSALQRKSVNG